MLLKDFTKEEARKKFKENPKEAAILNAKVKKRIAKLKAQAKKQVTFDLKQYCTVPDGSFFKNQYEFIKDEARFKTFDKSRRAGGTMSLAGLFLKMGLENPNIQMLYLSLDKGVAERIIWNPILKINDERGHGIKVNQVKLTMRFPNGSFFYILSARDRQEINKARGEAYYIVAIDEAQSIRNAIMEELVNDVLEASLIDYGGRLILVGTPNAACAGYFHDACRSGAWNHYHWTMDHNPWLPFKSGRSIEEIKKEHLDRKKITEEDPTYQREWLGKWVKDEHSIVYKYDREKNCYKTLDSNQTWRKVLGADIGFHDSDALCIWAFNDDSPNLYLIHSEENKHSDVSGFAAKVKSLEKTHGPFFKRVIDTGGLGKKITEELRNRHHIYFEAAEKTRKYEYIKLMNDDFRRGMIKAKLDSPIVDEWKILQWDTSTDPPKEDERFSNDMSDAALYGWREAKHYIYEPEVKPAREGTNRWAEEEWQRIGKSLQSNEGKEWWEDLG